MTAPERIGAFEDLGHSVEECDLRALRTLCDLAAPRYPIQRPWCCVDVGSWTGATARCIHRQMWKSLQRQGKVFCIDTFAGGECDGSAELATSHGGPEAVLRALRANMGKFWLERVVPLVGTSQQWAGLWSGTTLTVDLICLDARHDYDGCKEDIDLWLPHLRPGGLLCGLGYGTYDGVSRAVDQRGKTGLLGRSLWWIHQRESG